MLRPSILSVILLMAWALPALAEKRVALVIGNDAYASVPVLQKAVNDARTMAATLTELGFEVIAAENAARRDMNLHVQDFANRIEAGDVAMVFYAGHGVEIDGENFLLPTDIPDAGPGQEGFVKQEAVGLNAILDMLRARKARLNLVILDACRNNPFSRAAGRGIGATRGLARIEPPRGTFIMYSAGAGEEALDRLGDDDGNPNSVFTRTLVPLLKRPGSDLVSTARQVRRDVQRVAATVRHSQTPAYYDEVLGDFYFVPDDPQPTQPTAAGTASTDALELAYWTSIKDSGDVSAFEDYLRRWPAGVFVVPAQIRVKALKQKVAVGVFPQQAAPAQTRRYQPGETFRDCEGCPEMVVVPAGRFTMGSPEGEAERNDSESPQHEVRIAGAFAVGKFEVTFAEWDACVAGGGCNGYRPQDAGWSRGGRPVINVTWDDAQAYVSWLNDKVSGQVYRLLSEAEWEYAARAGTTTPFSTGSTITTDQANFDGTHGNSRRGEFRTRTVAVGSFASNSFGLHDMHGNVWEWTQDCLHDNYQGAPGDGSAWTSGDDCTHHALRGGSWNYAPGYLRSARRGGGGPAGFRGNSIGFRLARTLTP